MFSKLDYIKNELNDIERALSPYKNRINEAIEILKKDRESKGKEYSEIVLWFQVHQIFYEKNEKYKQLVDEEKQLPDEIDKLRKYIDSRRGFRFMLSECRSLINEHISLIVE